MTKLTSAPFVVTPSTISEDVSSRYFEGLRNIQGNLRPPDTAEAMLSILRDIARPTEKIVEIQEFETLVNYWYTHGNLSPLEFLDAPINLISAHNFLCICASQAIGDIDQIRRMHSDVKLHYAKELRAWYKIQAAERSLAEAREELGLELSQLRVHGAPYGGRLIPHWDPEIKKSYKRSWQARVDEAIEFDDYYRALTADTGHGSSNFESWATRYFFQNASIRCEHIRDRTIFQKPWKMLAALLGECFVARQSPAIRSTVEQFCARNQA